MTKLMIIAGSAGSISVVKHMLQALPKKIDYSIIVLIHQKEQCSISMAKTIKGTSKLPVVDPENGSEILKNYVYVAPPMYHIQVEEDKTISYTVDGPVNFSRPSIDVLLTTAAWVYQENLGVMILSGSSKDGASGAKKVLEYGGQVYVQDPLETEVPILPKSVLEYCKLQTNYTSQALEDILIHWGNQDG